MMIIIRLIKLLFLGDVVLWLLRRLLPLPRSRRNSCVAYFAMVCGQEEQNVRRREEELKGKGNVKTKKISLQWRAEPQALLLHVKVGPLNLPPSLRHPLQRIPQDHGHTRRKKRLGKLSSERNHGLRGTKISS